MALKDQLYEIEQKLLKIEFFKLISENLNTINSDKFKDVAEEVKAEVKAFIDAQVDMIETGTLKDSKELSTLFTNEEVDALKRLAARALQKTEAVNNPMGKSTEKKTPKKQQRELSQPDKISFALAHRNLGGKKVRIGESQEVGECVGIDAPYIIVKMESGRTVQTTPEEIRVC